MLNKTVIIEVQSTFGVVKVEFIIIDIINEKQQMYALLAQHKVVVGQMLVNGHWRLSQSIDLMDIDIIQNVLHKGVV